MVVFFIIIVYIIILFKQMSSIHMFLFIKRLESPVQLARVYIYIDNREYWALSFG